MANINLRSRLRSFFARLTQPRGRRDIAAMVRVKNEEEFIGAALDSIVEHVDQVVIIDNLSTDSTPDIIRAFAAANGRKVKLCEYPHEIARAGAESLKLSSDPRALNSPSLLANYYQWCLQWCDCTYVLKWDGDMVATSEFYNAIRAFRSSSKQSLWFSGLNVYPDMKHAIADSASSELIRPRSVATSEPRIFPKWLARYSSAPGVYEELVSPYMHGRYALHWPNSAYLHLPLCKPKPFHNNSLDFRWPDTWTLPYGQVLPESMFVAIQRWGLTSYCPPPPNSDRALYRDGDNRGSVEPAKVSTELPG